MELFRLLRFLVKNNLAVWAIVIFLVYPQDTLGAQKGNLTFSHLTPEDGLSKSNVTTILQDSKDFMWFGTSNGLNRYNGYEFTVYQYNPGNPRSLSHNYISSLYEDSEGRLWVGTSDGLNRYDWSTDSFQTYKHDKNNPGSISDNQIETIFEDSRGRLWVGTRNGGLNLFEREQEEFKHFIADRQNPGSLSSDFIQEIFEDSEGNLWIGHWSGAIDILRKQQNKFEHLTIGGEGLTDASITDIVESGNELLWIGTHGDGLYRIRYDDGVKHIAHYSVHADSLNGINSNFILSLTVDHEGNLWIGTENGGLTILDIQENRFHYNTPDPYDPSSLNDNSIYSIYMDHNGNTWLGTFTGGVNLLTRTKADFRHFQHVPGKDNTLSHNIVNAFWEDDNHNLWIATDGGGINILDRKTNTYSRIYSGNSGLDSDVILSFLQDSKDRFWIGTWADGLFLYDEETRKFTQYTKENSGLGSNNVFQILESSDGGLWLCTFWGGLTYFNADKKTVHVYNAENSGLTDNDTRIIAEDFDGTYWIGTDVGLHHFYPESKTFRAYRHDGERATSLSKGFVLSILVSDDSTLWVGTLGGLNRFDRETNTFKTYTVRDGLPNNEIKCILEDATGDLWLSTNKGLSSFDPETETFKNYDVSDGLQGSEFNPRSGYITPHGEFIFGGTNGFNLFNPDQIQDNPVVPPVVITDFSIFNDPVPIGAPESPLQKHISETRKLVLSHRHSVFSFKFAALNYISPEKNRYAYKMEGFETDWNYVGSRHTATYTNLDPGKYTFRVKASNNDGVWNEKGASLAITIEPPFWKTWWAYLIEALIVVGVIASVLAYYISRQRLRTALQREHLELEKMYELDQMKSQFFSNVSHEFYSPITLILSPLEQLLTSSNIEESVKERLKLVYRNAKRLKRMTSQLKELHKLETKDLKLKLSKGDVVTFIEEISKSFEYNADEHNIEFRFQSDEPQKVLWFDPDKLEKIVYNLLSNAFKFTPDYGIITLSISFSSSEVSHNQDDGSVRSLEYLVVEVEDNGFGIPEDEIDHIFDRYYSGGTHNGSNGRASESSGVGLALVKELVELYHGRITVDSEHGEGSKFTVHIPADEYYLEENQLVGEFTFNPSTNDGNADGIRTQEANPDDSKSSPSGQDGKDIPILLVIDDDPEIRQYISDILNEKYRIFEAQDSGQGLQKATEIIPDIILADIKMPGRGGIHLCDQLKQDERTSHVPIILMTAYSSKEYQIQGLSNGADAYLAKPFNIDILEAQILSLLEFKKKLREKFGREFVLGPKKATITDIDEKFLQRVINTVEEHISDSDFNAEDLGREIGMSRMQLYRKLRDLTDQTVHEFIRNIRLKRAVQLLEESRMTITEVAYEVGFNDLTYFGRCFKKHYNKSPSEYIASRS